MAFKRSLLLALVVTLSLISACGYKDIDKRFFVVSIGVDPSEQKDNKYKVSLKLAIPTGDIKAGKDKFQIISDNANSLTGAIRRMKSKVDKELDFSHAKVIIFGEEVAKKEVTELMDWFFRRRDLQKIAWVAVGRPTAEDILKVHTPSERLPSNALFLTFGQSGTESAYIISEYLFDFRKRVLERGLNPLMPIIEKNSFGTFTVNKTALFDNRKLKMVLDDYETKVLNMLMNRTEKVDLKVVQNKENSFYLSVDEVSSAYKFKNINGRLVIQVDVSLEGVVEEAIPYFSASDLDKGSIAAAETFKQKAEDLLKKMQKEQLDPIGLGLLYRSRHLNKDDWEQWRALYPDAKWDIKVDVTIQGTGGLH